MKKYKTKLPRAFVCILENMIINELLFEAANPLDEILMALLFEIKEKIYNKTGEVKKMYSFSFTPAQALALRVFCVRNTEDTTKYMDNKMLEIANQIHQHYA